MKLVLRSFGGKAYRLVRCVPTFEERTRLIKNLQALGYLDGVELIFDSRHPNSVWLPYGGL